MFKVRKFAGVLGLVALSLSGCNEAFVSEDPSLLSQEEQRIRSLESQRKADAIRVGALIGGIGGFLNARDKSRDEQIKAVLTGASIGAGLGYVAGEYVNSRARSYSSDQQRLRALIAGADRDIANYRSLNSTSARLISQQRNKVRSLNSRLRSGAISAEAYRTQIASANNNVRSLDRGVEDINKQIRLMKADRDQLSAARKSTSGLNSRISSLEAQKRTLESRRRALASVYDEVPDSVGAYDF